MSNKQNDINWFRDIISDESNHLSSGRLMSLACLLAAFILAFKDGGASNDVIAFLSAAVGGKTIQKFAETKKS